MNLKISKPLSIVGTYLVFGIIWILFSDILLEKIASDTHALTKYQTYKGWMFIVVTALLLYYLIHEQYKKIIETNANILKAEILKTELINRFNIAQKTARIGSWDWNMINNSIWWSEELYRILELNPGNYTPDYNSNAQYIHPEDRIIYRNEVERIIKDHGALDYDLRVITGKKNIKYCNTKGIVEYNEQGEPVRFYGTFMDITERKNAELALHESETRYHSLFEKSKDAILLTSPDGAIHDANPAACKMFGKTKEEIIQQGRNGIVDLTDERLKPALEERDKKGTATVELTMLKKGNIKFPVEITSTIFTDKNSELRTSMIIRDFTEHKQNEQKIKDLNNKLNQLISVNKKLASARNIESIQEIIKESLRKLINSDGVTFVLRDDDLCFYADEDAIEPLWKGNKYPMASCISGWAMIHRQTVIIEDIYKDSRIPIKIYKETFVKSLVMIPIFSNTSLGAIGNYWKEKHTPSDFEIKLLETIAETAAISIENIKLYNELELKVEKRTSELKKANEELEKINKLFFGREHRINELKTKLRSIESPNKKQTD
ncbi:MAG: hypothetical protein A2X13_02175 [Bacteroidetes bacterium GWC2_33_15]|nr:MAG: hypothetical protein A2X10_07450 [Bacteroidetes bacterium GWA2_33_15]OFX52282.1 MAG: hypothetical protein A2X13_02175 [Bacteroidetes bacterium GWC2_33_15]OFX64436.1 MAG: hypothetical protein A2X15_12995 [Bacteroidetes bacterium GWB2_32_14]OFX67841.1 MAG: hypothetical protein A2X14_06820 [Bacteroidetes bacterium GWD2_33_33]HAN19459.1 hypothetical protein [Bacteroidales bacterium]